MVKEKKFPHDAHLRSRRYCPPRYQYFIFPMITSNIKKNMTYCTFDASMSSLESGTHAAPQTLCSVMRTVLIPN